MHEVAHSPGAESEAAMRRLLFSAALLLVSRGANAACVISGVRPTVAVPTMAAGQDFSFLATADCEKLRFRVPGTPFVEIPKGGPDTGARLRTYQVVLTENEWDSLVEEGDTTFTWSIIGTTSAGVTTRVTTTNELKIEDGVTIDVSMADAKLVGVEGDRYVYAVGAGDVDADGHDDLLVSAWANDEGGSDAGGAYVVLGPVTGTLDLSLADAKLLGEEDSDNAGASVAGAGDVDADGHDDLLVGSRHNGGEAGAAYLVLGPVTGTLDLSSADAKLLGDDGDAAGQDVSGAGDVNADGHDDLLVSADANEFYVGPIYLVLGPATGTLDLSLADAQLLGEERYDFVESGTGAGDVDADGHDDVLVGAFLNEEGGTAAGAAYVVLGPVTGTRNLRLADAKLLGDEGDQAGTNISGAGDVDGDGHDDVLVGAPGNDEGGPEAGAAYLVMGPVTGTHDLSRAAAKLLGEERSDYIGWVSGAGDVDGEGGSDLLVGSYHSGFAYLVLGPVTGTIPLSRADAKFVDDDLEFQVSSASGAGDLNADGRADITVGTGSGFLGYAYIFYGGGL
jgi:hypothetical protein